MNACQSRRMQSWRWSCATILLAGFCLLATPAAAQFDRARAEANYIALARGEKALADLTPHELEEVRALERELRQAADRPRPSSWERCREEHMPEESEPTELELRLIDLKCSGR